jgi:hypothetical protein
MKMYQPNNLDVIKATLDNRTDIYVSERIASRCLLGREFKYAEFLINELPVFNFVQVMSRLFNFLHLELCHFGTLSFNAGQFCYARVFPYNRVSEYFEYS